MTKEAGNGRGHHLLHEDHPTGEGKEATTGEMIGGTTAGTIGEKSGEKERAPDGIRGTSASAVGGRKSEPIARAVFRR